MGTAAKVNDVTQAGAPSHLQETAAFGDAGDRGVDERPEAEEASLVRGHAARQAQGAEPDQEVAAADGVCRTYQGQRGANFEHPFRAVKQRFGHAKLRYRGLARHTARPTMPFALSNLWMARRQVLGAKE